MPGKHVRFAEKNIIHPLPTLSSPLASPYAPLTPPSLPSSLSPVFIPPPFPRPVITPPTIHPLLQSSRTPILNFDLRQPPSTITSNHHRLSRKALYEAATVPPLRSLTIIISDLSWIVTVKASHQYVTVQDVLDELYYSLRRNISAQEFHAFPNDQVRRKVTMAYEQRYRRITSPREYEDEKRRGATRVDLLMGHNKFLGLLSTSFGPDYFFLHTG